MKSWVVGLSLAMACAVGAQSVSAASVTLNFVAEPSPGLSSGLRVDFGGHTPDSNDALGVGAFKWTVASQSGSPFAVGSTLFTFCIQASQAISSAPTYTIGSLTNSPVGGTDAGAIDAVAQRRMQDRRLARCWRR